jgi:hypothetical protein
MLLTSIRIVVEGVSVYTRTALLASYIRAKTPLGVFRLVPFLGLTWFFSLSLRLLHREKGVIIGGYSHYSVPVIR